MESLTPEQYFAVALSCIGGGVRRGKVRTLQAIDPEISPEPIDSAQLKASIEKTVAESKRRRRSPLQEASQLAVSVRISG